MIAFKEANKLADCQALILAVLTFLHGAAVISVM
jgi:hypothetical protein